MFRYWMFMSIGVVCFITAVVFAKFNIVVVGSRYYPPQLSALATANADEARRIGSHYSVDEVRGWAPDVTNAGASGGFAIAGGLCMIAAAMSDRRVIPIK